MALASNPVPNPTQSRAHQTLPARLRRNARNRGGYERHKDDWRRAESMGDEELGPDGDKGLPRGVKTNFGWRHDYSTLALAVTGSRWRWA
jgi:hypothetical protein